MSRQTAGIVAWTLVAVSTVAGLTGAGLKAASESVVTWHYLSNDVIGITILIVSAAVGGLVASRLPANPIGWLFIGLVVTLSFSGAADGYAAISVHHGRLGGLVPWAALYESKVFVVFFVTLLFSLLLFPDGKLPSSRWRIVAWTGTTGIVICTVAVVLTPGTLDGYPQLQSPTGVDSPIVSWLFLPGFVLFCAALVGAAASVVVRFRRSRGVERQQLTLLMGAGVVATTTFLAGGFIGSLITEDLGIAITLLGVLTIPVAIGVAMLRYRLYEIDRVISRTLVYGAADCDPRRGVRGPRAGGPGPVLVVRRRLEPRDRGVDPRRRRALPAAARARPALRRPALLPAPLRRAATLEAFGARLREQVEIETLAADLRRVVGETMQPAHVSLWLREGAREPPRCLAASPGRRRSASIAMVGAGAVLASLDGVGERHREPSSSSCSPWSSPPRSSAASSPRGSRRNPIGWIFCGFSAFRALSALAAGYARDRARRRDHGPRAGCGLVLQLVVRLALRAAVFVLLLFPDGRLPRRRWRSGRMVRRRRHSCARGGLALAPGPLDDYPSFDEPGRGRRGSSPAVSHWSEPS